MINWHDKHAGMKLTMKKHLDYEDRKHRSWQIGLNTWWRNLCWQAQRSDICCSFSAGLHRSWEGFWSLHIHSKFLRFQGCHLATRSFSSLHRFSMGFRSGDWLGHSRTLICFFLSHSFVALALYFGSLSCWKTHPWPIFSALTEGRRLSPKISQYMAPFILPSIWWSLPVPLAEKHDQSIRFPPPCFTVGMVFLGLHSAFLFL